ncbi:extracellular matrix protein 1 isoform X2 [Esox lucius]|uniref:Extracellular matrix protein 1b n=1 Tax=Esox lucius TaxID=8010 RepID=A0A6Q2YK99_ESOLU|nr:extracellular matrix protein 1 isoform X2 [Esox lucius]
MFWSWTVAFVLVCASAASEDEPDMEQREVFDPDLMIQRPLTLEEILGSRNFPGFLQKPVTVDYDLLFERADSDTTQKEVSLDSLGVPPQGLQMARPRSFVSTQPSVLFPPGQPSPDNLHAICTYSNHRPRYHFTDSGFSYFSRKGDAVNQLESWYSTCCHGNGTQQLQEAMLCCAKQAWEQSLSTYCEVESSIKTRQPECCKKTGGDRLSCFHKQAPNPTYMPFTEETGSSPKPETVFTFNPNTCHTSQPSPRSLTETNPSKPPKAAPGHSDISCRTGCSTSHNADSDTTQKEVSLDSLGVPPQGLPMARHPSFVRTKPSVLFPPGQPSPDNLHAICTYSNLRPRYPIYYFPKSDFGYLSRQDDAVNQVESWYSTCCHLNGTQQLQEAMLCCVKQAWEQSLSTYCEVESSIEIHQPECCMKMGRHRLSCFHKQAPNPTYMPFTEETGSSPNPETAFTFNPNTCHTSQPGPHGVRGNYPRKPSQAALRHSDISFPPGRPTSQNIELICSLLNRRPLYNPQCLPRTGYGWLARQSKAVNRLERGFKLCCERQKDVLACADRKWREVLDRFCDDEQKGTVRNSSCCGAEESEQRYTCFSSRAPHPAYDQELHFASDAPQAPTLGHICETHKIIKKKFPVPLPVQSFVSLCCSLPADQRTPCIQEKLVTHAERQCPASMPTSHTVSQKCCYSSSQNRHKCLSGLLMKAINKATKSTRFRKCPLS